MSPILRLRSVLSRRLSRTFACPRCGRPVRIPLAWIAGIEVVFRCPGCRTRFRTGYRLGAVLHGTALALALAAANLSVWILGSRFLVPAALLVVPGWLTVGYALRRLALGRRCRIR